MAFETRPPSSASSPPARPARPGQWSEAALRVLRERYLGVRPDGTQETPEDMLWRVSWAVARVEERFGRTPDEIVDLAGRFYDLMVRHAFMPNSPTLMNAGRDNGLQYSACYVLPIDDSMESIFDAIKKAALIHKSGGGTGFSFSRLRPRNSEVQTTGGYSSGPVSFLRVFNAATEAVKQGGVRRGANMGILRVDHPDILEFVEAKLGGGLVNFNLSVAITEAFLEALRQGGMLPLVDHRGQEVGRVEAAALLDRIVECAWRTGDPGLVFIDRINRWANPTPEVSLIEATNPCGEQPLAPNEACNLGSINLSTFVRPGPRGCEAAVERIDWEALGRAVDLAVRFLDDVIEANPYPLPEIDATVKANRRIGLGVMGWANLLLDLGIPYADESARDLARRVMGFVTSRGRAASHALGADRGSFLHFDRSVYRDGLPLRNASVTTIAPTGTISMVAGCSSGIEPIFALAFSHVVGERHLRFVNPVFERIVREEHLDVEAVMKAVLETGTVQGLEEVPEGWQHVLRTAHEISPEHHVRMQAAFQEHTDSGVSKTINLPADASPADVRHAYLLASELGCLGITVFRDRCRTDQVLHVGQARRGSEAAGEAPGKMADRVPPRPRSLQGVTWRVPSPLGTCFITINHDEGGEPLEVFANVGKAGSDIAAVSEGMGRLISLILRLPSPFSARERVEEVVYQLSEIGGARHTGFGRQRVRSLPDAIAQALAEHLGLAVHGSAEVDDGSPVERGTTRVGDLCPECGQATLVFEEGCQKCQSCGYSLC